MEIVLVRHAQPDWEPDGVARDDPGLTDLGHEQATLVADALRGERFDAIYTSPLQRVVETAAPVCEALGMEPRVCTWLRELGLPTLEGRTTEQVRAYFEDANARELDAWWDGLPGGESFRHFLERVSSGIEGLLAGEHRLAIHEAHGFRLWQLPEKLDRILIVAHEGTNAVLLSHLLGLEPVPWAHARFSSDWAGISRIEATPTASGAIWALESFNRTSHLAPLRHRLERSGRSLAQ